MLALIFVAVLLGLGTVAAGEAGQPLARGLQSLSNVLLKVVGLVMEFAPFGVFALSTNAIAANGLQVFAVVGWLYAAVILGSLLQMAVVHSLILKFLAKVKVIGFFRTIIDALVVAFSTSSSAATLPVEMRIAGERLNVPRPIYSSTLPLGAAIGKDGTAMYVGLLTVFAIQALGLPAGPQVYALALVVGAVTAFGTAPVPSASLFMLAAVLSAVGATPEQTALIVGFILPFDRIPDMIRTVPSVCANMTVMTTVARWERDAVRNVEKPAVADVRP
jgi:Na+/H+-dicarboxylate symporter